MMDPIIKWVGLIAALITIIGAAFNLFTGIPFNSLLSFWDHRLTKIKSFDGFDIEAVCTKSGKTINPNDKFSYKFDIPLDARGMTKFSDTEYIWIVLKDQHGGYYLQHPPVDITTGEWRAYNIRPLEGVKRIVWLKVDESGNAFFKRKADNGEWGKFTILPDNSKEIAYAELR
jgi:hypothetical protein